jgi:Resolvase, N terminal domain
VLDFLRAGDVLMITRIDRLARSIGDLQDIVRTLRATGEPQGAQGRCARGFGGKQVAPVTRFAFLRRLHAGQFVDCVEHPIGCRRPPDASRAPS